VPALRKPFSIAGGVVVEDSAVISGLLYPISDGTDGQVLTTNGAGVLTFTSVSGGGGGVTNLADLDDVIVAGLEQGGILQYDSAEQKWVVSNDITEEQQDLTSDGGFY